MMDINEDKQIFVYLYGKAGRQKIYLLTIIILGLEFE